MINATVEMDAITMMCFGRSFSRSEEKQQTNTMTRATMSELRVSMCFQREEEYSLTNRNRHLDTGQYT